MSDITGTMGEQVLGALGLDAVCVQVYLMMHADPDADAGKIAEQLKLALPEVNDAVDTLVDLTLLRTGVERTGRLRPVSIERALHTLLRQHSEQLTLQNDALATLQSAMKDLLAAPRAQHENPAEMDIEVVSGPEAIQSRIDALAMRATESFYAIFPGAPQPSALEAARPIDRDMARRGIRVRVLYQNVVRADRRNVEYMRWLHGLGAETRYAAVVPPRMILIDGKTVLVSLRRTDRPGAFVIREPGIIEPLAELFELSWAAGEPLTAQEAPVEDPQTPNSQELALLRILAAGSTDEAAAKKLGVSVRTVRRMMADLMERLGATSRFEAGHRATRRGWL